MQNTLERIGDVAVVALRGRLDAITAAEFDKQSAAWTARGNSRVLLDMSELNYISSAGLRSILSLLKRVKPAGGELALCCLHPLVAEVFSISGLACYLPIHRTRDEAVCALAHSPCAVG